MKIWSTINIKREFDDALFRHQIMDVNMAVQQ